MEEIAAPYIVASRRRQVLDILLRDFSSSQVIWHSDVDQVSSSERCSGTEGLGAWCRNFFRRKYGELEAGILKEHKDVFDEATFSRDNFLQTAIVIRCKTHAPLENDKIALVPIADQVGWGSHIGFQS